MEDIVPEEADIVAEAKKVLGAGDRLYRRRSRGERSARRRQISLKQKTPLFSTSRTSDDALREEQCRAMSFTLRRAMRCARTLWVNFSSTRNGRIGFSFTASNPTISIMSRPSGAPPHASGRRIVAERNYTYDARTRDTDTGHQQTEQQMALLTQSCRTMT